MAKSNRSYRLRNRVALSQTTECVCSACGAEAQSLPDRRHRDCPKAGKAKPGKRNLPVIGRGKWVRA